MNCRRARWAATLAARGELDAERRERLLAHLAGCRGCRRVVEADTRLDRALRSCLGRMPIAVDLRPAVMRRLPERTAPLPRWRWPTGHPPPVLRRAPVLGFAAAAVALGFFIWRAGWSTGPTGPRGPRIVAGVSQPPSTVPGPDRPSQPPAGPAREGDRYASGPEGGLFFALADGTSVTLDRSSAAMVTAPGLQLEYGRLHAEVAPQARHFVVSTPEAQVRVLGTRFGLELREGGGLVVVVTQGSVRVVNAHGQAVVPAGAFTVARRAVPPLPAERVDTAALLEWAGPLAGPGQADPFPMSPQQLATEIQRARRETARKKQEVAAVRRSLENLRRRAGMSRMSDE